MSRVLLSVELPGLPPTTNMIYRTWGQKKRTKTPETRRWQDRTAATLAAIWKRETVTGDVAVSLVFMTRDRKRWDIDNRLKALLDTFKMAGVLKDDSQIKALMARRCRGEETKTLVELAAIGE